MRHLALILITSSFFTACMTDTDKALWAETKDAFSSEGKLVSSAVAEIKGEGQSDAEIAEKNKAEPAVEAPAEQKPVEATTGR